MEPIKIPAIRAKMGLWVYYIATMTFSQIQEHVKKVDNELHKSTVLSEMLQRSITDNYKKIAKYLIQQEERFFNSLVLAVYDGDPKWHEVRLDYGYDEEYYDIGLLELTGNEKIFPVDGQHRVEGIKEAIVKKPGLKNEKVPVIFIGHKNDYNGMRRARRLFSTLNRYAKPVSLSDIIALDEDDAIAIVTRELIENHPLFEGNRILNSKTKAIPENNTTAFTTIITFYECNRELLHLFLEDKEVRDIENKKVRGKSKATQFIKFRPDQELLDSYNELCTSYWNAFSQNLLAINDYLECSPDTSNFRNKNGGNILFRPVALLPFVQASIHIKRLTEMSFDDIFLQMNSLPLLLTNSEWGGILWDSKNKRMIMGNKRLVKLRLISLFNTNLLTENEKKQLVRLYATATQMQTIEAEESLGLNLRDN
jgi:DNA sulfur modification protein DndB